MAVAAISLAATPALADTPPEVPVTFSGTLAAGETQTVQFTVPWVDNYTANLYPADGHVTLTLNRPYPNTPIQNFQGGVLIPVTVYSLDIHATVATTYNVDIEEVPPKLTDVSSGLQYLGPNDVFRAIYTLNVPAYVEPVITIYGDHDPMVVPVRSMTSPGTNTLTWNLRDADGKRLPDGWYNVALRARNSSTALAVPAGEVIIDTTPPLIDLQLDGPADSDARVHVAVVDPGGHAVTPHPFAIASVKASADGGPAEEVTWLGPWPGDWSEYSAPGGKWTPGKHTVTVEATDDVGNSASSSISFTVPGPTSDATPQPTPAAGPSPAKPVIARAPGPDCSMAAIKTAIRPFSRQFKLAQHDCSDLTGDGASELVVLLRAKRGSKTVAAIYRQAGANWALAYRDTRHRISRIGRLSHDLKETLRGGGKLRVHWNGGRFLASRA